MSQSVSLILPVCNQQRGLRNLVLDVAEVLTDLATWFEILIIDYGSADPALDAGAELAREFPQIRFLARNDARLRAGNSARHPAWRKVRSSSSMILACSSARR